MPSGPDEGTSGESRRSETRDVGALRELRARVEALFEAQMIALTEARRAVEELVVRLDGAAVSAPTSSKSQVQSDEDEHGPDHGQHPGHLRPVKATEDRRRAG